MRADAEQLGGGTPAQLLRAVLDNLPAGVVLVDGEGRVRYWNSVAYRLLGPELGEASVWEWPARCGFIQTSAADAAPAEQLPVVRVLAGHRAGSADIFLRRPDLQDGLWIEMQAAPWGNRGGAIVILNELSDRKRVEDQLREEARRAREELHKFFRGIERSPAVIVITGVQGDIEYVNPRFTELTGYTFEEVRGKNPRILKSGHTPPEVYRELWETISAGHEWSGEFLNRKKNGELYWEWASISPVTAPDGTITHFIAIKEDITVRKQFEQALQEANATLRAVIETSPLAICTLDLEGRVTSWNWAAEQIFGWRQDEVLGRVLPLLPDERRAELQLGLEASGPGGPLSGTELPALRKDGSRVQVNLWSASLRSAQGQALGLLVLLADITERKWLEEQLRQVQKMEAIGRLAGGLAHDFNNLLTVITGYGELLLTRLQGPEREDLEAVMDAAHRATALTRQLLAVSRRQVSQPRVVDLNGVIRGMERLLRRAVGEDISLDLFLQSALWSVSADPAQLEQVLLNLAVNARDAMPRGGRLVITTANCKAAEAAALRLPPGQYVRLTVRDTGEGMDAEACRRVFEPFFSTKPRDKGTGLGLSIVYGIVKQGGGEVFVESQPGEGTVFTVYWPRATGARQVTAPRQPAVPAAANREVILLVEDEDGVRRLVRDTLVRHGYSVLEAADGLQALQVFEEHAARIDLLLTDVVMPQMSGRELAVRLTSRRPDLVVMFMSGYTGDVMAEHGLLEPGVLLLPKPFSAPTLLRRLREALDSRGRRK